MNRRDLLRGALMGGAALALNPVLSMASGRRAMPVDLAALERRHGGHLGVAVLDTKDGRRLACHGDERFLMCSTFKLLLVAAILERVDAGKERLERRVVFGKDVLQEWAPVTGLNVGPPGMSIGELCEAAMLISDNTAANLLLDTMGGPPALTTWVRSLGDGKTRLDHREPELNRPHGEDDTTTPWAMLEDMRRVLLGNVLSAGSRERLTNWFVLNQTGSQTLRAGLPSGWRVGDKTGSGSDANNDIAVIWPPDRKPLLVTAYYSAEGKDTVARKAVLAEVGRQVAVWYGGGQA